MLTNVTAGLPAAVRILKYGRPSAATLPAHAFVRVNVFPHLFLGCHKNLLIYASDKYPAKLFHVVGLLLMQKQGGA